MTKSDFSLARGLPMPLRMGAMIFSAVFSVYFWLTYSGPYRWFAELQMQLFSAYFAIAAWMASFLLLSVAMVLALQAARRLGAFGESRLGVGEPQAFKAARFTGIMTRYTEFMRQNSFVVVFALAGCILLFIAGQILLLSKRSSELEVVNIEVLEASSKPHSSWLEVSGGSPALDAVIKWRDGNARTDFVPVCSPQWEKGQPIAVILSMSESEFDTLSREATTFRGLCQGMPTPVKVALRDAGLNVDHAIVLTVGEDPGGLAETVNLLGLMGGGLIVLAAAIFVRRRRKS